MTPGPDPPPIRGRWTTWRCPDCGWTHSYDEPMTDVYCVACHRAGHGPDRRCERSIPPNEAVIERAKEAAHEAYHTHNGECGCRTVGHLTEYIALAAVRAALEAPGAGEKP